MEVTGTPPHGFRIIGVAVGMGRPTFPGDQFPGKVRGARFVIRRDAAFLGKGRRPEPVDA